MFKRRKNNWYLIPIALLIIGVFLAIKLNLFTIKKIEVKTEGNLCIDENQLKISSALLGQNFFLINSSKIEQNLMQKFYCLKSVSLSKRLPNAVTIQVSERQPIAILINLKEKIATTSGLIESIATPSAEQIGNSYLIDNEGVIFAKANDENNIPKVYNQEDNLNANLLKILIKAKTFGVQIQTSWISDGFLITHPPPKIIFDLNNQVDIQLASLQLILDKAKIDSETLEFIDLRFDKPVVRYAPKK